MSIARKAKRAGALKTRPKAEMVFVPGGEFAMGSDHHYAEEKPAHRVQFRSNGASATGWPVRFCERRGNAVKAWRHQTTW